MAPADNLGFFLAASFPDLGIPLIKARVDSGAKTSALHAINIVPFTKEGVNWVKFDINPIQNNLKTSLTLNVKSPLLKLRKYEGDFEMTVREKNLSIVNLVDMDTYLAGVVESEGGGGRQIEYYKVQALMSRTYALKYLGKHKKEGFDLCDRDHCQAYHNMLI